MSVSGDDVQTLFEEWRAARKDIYTVVFEPAGKMVSFVGVIESVSPDEVVIGDSSTKLRLPIASQQSEIARHSSGSVAVTMTWADGRSAFVATRR